MRVDSEFGAKVGGMCCFMVPYMHALTTALAYGVVIKGPWGIIYEVELHSAFNSASLYVCVCWEF